MKRAFATALSIIGTAMVISAQGGASPQNPPRPNIVGYMPQVADLDKANHFYHDLLGLESKDGDPTARLE